MENRVERINDLFNSAIEDLDDVDNLISDLLVYDKEDDFNPEEFNKRFIRVLDDIDWLQAEWNSFVRSYLKDKEI